LNHHESFEEGNPYRKDLLDHLKRSYNFNDSIWPDVENLFKIDKLFSPVLPPHVSKFSFCDDSGYDVTDYLEIGKMVVLEKVNTAVSLLQDKIHTVDDIISKKKGELDHIPTLDEIRPFMVETFGKKLSKLINVEIDHKWIIDDSQYALDRLTGINPNMIEKCKKDPVSWPSDITESEKKIKEDVEKYLKLGKLFMCDYGILEGIKCVEGRVLEAPLTLFVQLEKLEPLCIQIKKKGPVFSPKDDQSPNGAIWYLAKTFVGNAENHFQQFATHVVPTHFVMEVFYVASRRTLSAIHPLSLLLYPHFKKMISVNFLARTILLGKGQMVDIVLSSGRTGGVQIAGRKFAQYNFEDHKFKNDIKNRGVEPEDLPYYPYRDDAKLWDDALTTFVTDIVHIYYGSTADEQKKLIAEDLELQSFVTEVYHQFQRIRPDGKHGFPSALNSADDLISYLTNMISYCSYKHALMNYAANAHYAFTPNAPATLRKHFPEGRNFKVTWRTILETLPNHESALRQTGMAKQLSMVPEGFNTFGKAEFQYKYLFKNPKSKEAIKKFQENVKQIEKTVAEREKNRVKIDGRGYPWLEPSKVTFSIEL